MKVAVRVSEEMVTLVGPGRVPDVALPPQAAVFHFDGFVDGSAPQLGYRAKGSLKGLESLPLVFVVSRAACRRIFAYEPVRDGRWHLTSHLRSLALTLIDCEATGEARTTLRLARSIELLCQLHGALQNGQLVAIAGDGQLSEMDVARIANVRRIVDQRWQEKLTIPELAQIAGINRDKLVRGFRQLYATTIAAALTERRLAEARRMLLATDMPVASVAYACSYLNNASFTRAFTRRFGIAPTEMRRLGVAA